MNYLLHLRLTERAGLPAPGAIIGDVLRGRLDPALPPPLARSIALHRRIDALSDRHPLLGEVRAGFPPSARRYAGIVLDLVCDVLAAADWPDYGSPGETLPEFCRRQAAAVADPAAWRLSVGREPPAAGPFAALLLSFGEAAGVERAIVRIASRLREPAPFRAAAAGWRGVLAPTRAVLPEVYRDLAAAARGFAED